MNLKKKLMAFAVSMGAMMLVVSPLPVRAAEVDSQSYSVLETEIESNEVYMDTTSDEQGKMAGSAESTVPADTEEIASGEVQESQTETTETITPQPAQQEVESASPVQSEQGSEATVWISETGSKYHSKNNCGRMNPDKATQVTEQEAISMGLGKCSKCW